MTLPSIFTAMAVSWYSLMRPTICTSGPVTRPATMLKAISAPTVIVPLNTCMAPKPRIAICSDFSSMVVETLASAAMRATAARRCTPSATVLFQVSSRRGSMASDFTVRMPWMVSTRRPCRAPSAWYSRSSCFRKMGTMMPMMAAMATEKASTTRVSSPL